MDKRITAVYELGQKLVLLHDLHEIAETVLATAVGALDFRDCDFFLVDERRQELFIAARRGHYAGEQNLRIPLDIGASIPVTAVRNRQAIYIPNIEQDSRYIPTDSASLCELSVPVQRGEHVLGVINARRSQPDAFNSRDQKLLAVLAQQAALALAAMGEPA